MPTIKFLRLTPLAAGIYGIFFGNTGSKQFYKLLVLASKITDTRENLVVREIHSMEKTGQDFSVSTQLTAWIDSTGIGKGREGIKKREVKTGSHLQDVKIPPYPELFHNGRKKEVAKMLFW